MRLAALALLVTALASGLAACRGADTEREAPGGGDRAGHEGGGDRAGHEGGGDRAGHEAAHPAQRAPAATPVWRVRVPGASSALLERAVGPVLAGDSVLVGSSAIGLAGVDAATGALRWQRAEPVPERPVVVGDALYVAGSCAHAAGRGAAALMGCVEIFDLTGRALRERAWVPGAETHAPPGQRHVLGAWDRAILWAAGSEVVAFEPGAERVVRYALPVIEGAAGRVCGHLAGPGDALIVASCAGLAGFARARDHEEVVRPRWLVRAPRTPSVAGPVWSDARVVWVRDETLEAVAPDDGHTLWRARGRFAHAPGALHADGPGSLLAVSLDQGIRPVRVDAGRGEIRAQGERAPGIQVLAAAHAPAGPVLIVRLDASLERDAVVGYDQALRMAWMWPLPAPAHPRVEPVGLAVTNDAVIVFHDGRDLARLGHHPTPR